jgi:FkbM family methyltransferase
MLSLARRVALGAIRRSTRASQLLTVRVPSGRFGMVIPIIHGFGLSHLEDDPRIPWFVAIMRRLVAEKPGAMVDVGAHVGAFMLMWHKAAPGRAYYGFEPHTACAYYLEKLIAANDLPDHCAVPLGLSDRSAVLTLHSNSEKDVFATTAPTHHAGHHFAHKKPIAVEPGDVVLEQLGAGAIAFIKIDVEGAELEVLRGLTRTIERDRPFLHLEVSPYHKLLASAEPERRTAGEYRRGRVQEVGALLSGWGYTFQRIHYTDRLEPRDTLDPDPAATETDVLCVPKELAHLVGSGTAG